MYVYVYVYTYIYVYVSITTHYDISINNGLKTYQLSIMIVCLKFKLLLFESLFACNTYYEAFHNDLGGQVSNTLTSTETNK